MGKLDAKQARAIAEFMRAYGNLYREMVSARALLKFCQEKQVYPLDYKQELESLKTKVEYSDIGKVFDIAAAHLEQAAEETDLSEILNTLPKDSPAN